MAEETQIYKKNYEDDTKFYRKNYGKDAKFYRNNLGKDAKFYRKNYKTDNKDTNKDIELLKTRIKKHEGNAFGEPVLIPYYLEYDDANGNHIKEDWLTGGHGTQLSKNHKEPEGGYTKEYWNKRFDERFDIAHKGAIELLGTETDYRAIGVITEMMYQMGVDGVKKFKKTLKYIKNEQWELASVEMLDSKWAVQTNPRAVRLSKVIKNIK